MNKDRYAKYYKMNDITLYHYVKARILFALLFFLTTLSAYSQTCEVTLRNDSLIDANNLIVDIYVKATSGSFYYSGGQYKVTINTSILNGGSLTGSIVAGYSDLTNSAQIPSGVIMSPTSTYWRITAQQYPNTQAECSQISETGNGTRICRVKLTNTNTFAESSANMAIVTTSPYATAIWYSDTDGSAILAGVTMVNTNLINPVLNGTIISYNVTGSGTTPSAVGLDGSQSDGVNYLLYKNSIAQGSPVNGTGSAISFGTQTEGTYTVKAHRKATYMYSDMAGNAIITSPVPTAYNVTGSGSYCQGAVGLPVGLNDSETGVTYTLYKNGESQLPTVNGTGEAISFGTQLFGTYTVKGTNTGGTTDMTGSAIITVNALPTITGTLSVCAGSTTQLTGSGLPAATNPWVSATTSVATVSSTGLVTGVTAGTSIITYTDINGCIRTATVTVNALPTITGTLSVCAGSTTQLTGSGLPAATNPWVSATTSVATVSSTGLVTGVTAGTSIITYTDINGCSRTATVTVNSLPTANAGSALTAICQGVTSAALGGSVGGSATGGTWSTSAGGTFSPDATTLNATWTPPSAYSGTATLTLTTSGGSCGTAIASKTQVVNPNAVITLTSGSNTQTVCISTAITNIVYTVSGGGTGAGVTGLPTGVSGVYSGGAFTISGTPTVSGTYNYIVTTTGTCTQATATGTITVNPNAAITLTSGSSTQTVCINATIANIVYTVSGGGTGAGVTGLPTGVSGTYNSGSFTISGTPTVSGTFNYIVTTTGTCTQATATGTITVNPLPTANAGSALTAICQGGTSAALGGSVGGSATGGTWSTSAGGTFSPDATTLNATWTPPAAYSGTATLTLTTSGGSCGTAIASKTQVVNPNAVITLASGSNTQTVCISTAITNIVYTVSGGGTGAGVTGLPTGVSGVYSGGAFTISGTPTVSGTYNYIVTTTGTCTQATATGTITVNPNAAITLTSGSSTQTVCLNSAITNMTYSVTGGGTGAGVTGLPTGVSGTYNSGSFTISGTPTVSGTFNYIVTTTGTCTQATATGTITVNPLPTANAGSALTAICQGGTSAALGGSVGGSATGGTWSTSAGGTFSPDATTLNATWTPPAAYSGTATLTLTTSGGSCGTAIASKTQVVNPNAVITLTSGSNTQTVCISTAITNIVYTVSGGGTGAGVTGLPTGVSGVYSGGAFTINGTPTVSGTYNYIVTTTGTCTQATATGTITVNPNAAITLTSGSSTQTVCLNSAITNITYSVTGGGTGAGVTGLPTGVSGTYNSGSFTISGTPTVSGTFNYTVSTTGTCVQTTATGTIIVNPLPTATISGTTAVCKDADSPNVTFTGANGTAPYTFTYKINSGSNQTTTTTVGNSVTVSVPTGTAGTFIYSLLSVRDASTTTCSQAQTGNAVVTVNPLPTATISGTTAVCIGAASPNITFTGASGTAPYTFTYTINSGSNQTITTTSGNSVTVSVPTSTTGTFTYALVSVRDASATACSQAQGSSATVTVNPLPTATIGGTTTICKDAASPNITFTGENGTAPYTFTYTINSDGNQTVTTTSGNSVTVGVPTGTSGTFTYALISVRDGSATACSQPQTGNAVVTINQLPTATISGTTTVCKDAASPDITFTGANGTAPYTFTYTVNSGSNQTVTTTSGNSVTVSVATSATGIFTYSLVSVRDASATTCSQIQTGSATITVNPLPTATISGTTAVCRNAASPNITFTGANGTEPYTFTYRINSGSNQTVTTSSGNSVTVAVPTGTAGTFTYTLVSVQDASTSACTQAQTGSAVVTINPLPTATISGTTSVCKDAVSPNITFTGANGTAPYTFTYKINTGSNQTVTTTSGNSVTVAVPTSTSGTFTYTLVSIQDASATGCSQTQTGSVIVTVNPLPTTSAISGSQTPACSATGIVYSVTLTTGSTYTWSVPTGATITSGATGPNNNSITVNFGMNNGNIGVVETLPTGCSGSQVTLAISLQGCTLNANFSASSTSICTGSSVIFTSLSTGVSGSTTYSWNFGTGATPSTATGSGPHTVTYTSSGSKTVSLTITEGASDTETKTNYITVNPLPTASISGTTSVCEDAASPNILFTGANGTAPYTFTYKINSGSNQTVTTTSGSSVTVAVPTGTAGTFTYTLVSVQDASSTTCSQVQTGSAIVTVNPLPTATITGTTSVCKDAASPNITFTGANGTAPYTFTYKINSGSNQTVITTSGNSATVSAPTGTTGTFTYSLVSVRDASTTTCSQAQTGSAIVTVNPLPTASISGTTAVCRDAASPNITFTGANGTAPYTFTYTVNSGSNQTVTTTVGNSVTVAVPTGTAGTFNYTLVSVQDASSSTCSQTQTGSAVVTVNSLPTATISGTTAVCKDAASPNITFTGANGIAPYTFTYTINSGSNQTIATTSGNSVTIAVPTGTAGIFTYSLVSVRDASSTTCSQAQTGSAVVTVNTLPTATISGTTVVCKNEVSPNITFTGANGTAPYTFTYTINSGSNRTVTTISGNSVTVAVPTGTAGIFTYALVSVRDASATTCSQIQTGSATVTINQLPSATISGTTAVCKDAASPNITFTGANGTAPYTFTYTINSGSNLTVTTTSGNSVTVSVPTGTAGIFTYSLVSVRDASTTTCSQAQTGSAIVTINPLPTATISGTTAVCRNAASPNITFTGASGTAPYTFTYTINSGSSQTVTTTSGNSVTVSVPTNATGIFTYALVSVRDASTTACYQAQGGSATVTVNPLPTATIGGTTTVCKDAASPNITFTGANGTAPYTFTYRINSGSNQTITTSSGNSVTVAVPTGTAGTFTYALVSVQDASTSTCLQAQTGNAVVTINPLPTATISGTTAVCIGAASPNITFTGANGTAPYTFTYTVNSGSNQTVSTTSGNSVTVSVPTSATGIFTYSLVSVRDASATTCLQIQTGSATITVNPLPTATISGTTAVCRNAASPNITFTGANGTEPYIFTYRINSGSNQTVTTSSGNSVTVAVPTGTAGTFTYTLVSVQDASTSACTQAQTGSAVVTINPLPTATISGTTSVCKDAVSPNITFTGANGTAPYTFTYKINTGSNQTVTTTSGNSVAVAVPTSTSGTFTYTLVSIQDASTTGCSQTQTGSAIVTVNPLPTTSAISGSQTPACSATGIVYSVTLTTGSTYTWSVPTGATITSGATGPNNNSITVNFGMNNGNIGVVETLPTGCSGAQVTLAISLQGCTLNANFSASSTSICTGSSVIFTSLSTGVSGSTTYSWNFGTGATPSTATGSGPHTVTYTSPGSKTVSLTITEGASDTETKTNYITVNPLPTASISGTTSVCEDAASPNILFTGANGTAPYTFTYKINSGSNQTVTTTSGSSVTVAVPTGTAGTFTYTLVSVEDASSTTCSQVQTGSAIVTVNPLPTATITGTTSVCKDAASPNITFTGANGTAPYTFTYKINSGSNQTVITTSGNSATVSAPTGTTGTFTYSLVSVRDASTTTCSQAQTGSAIVTVNPLPTASISGTTAVCRDAASPNITFTGANGTAPYTFTYTVNSGSNQTVTTTVGNSVTVAVPTSTTGIFTYSLVSVRDASATTCSQIQTGSATITVNPLPTATISGTTAVCKDAASPNITFTGANGTAPYTFTYTINSGSNQTIATTSGNSVTVAVPTGTAGIFTYSLVSVRDASSTTCSQAQTGSAVVTVNTLPTAIISGTTVVCKNEASPNITFTGANGTAPYTFTYTINSGSNQTVTTTSGNSVTVPAPTGTVGIFTYALVSVRDGSTTACSQIQGGSATITVNPLPTASISGTTVACKDAASPSITFTGANGTAPYTFTYKINSGSNQTVTTISGNSVTVPVPTGTAGVFTYSLVSVRDASTTTCSQTQTGSAVVTVNPLPTASISGTAVVCKDAASPNITFTGASGMAPYTFTYQINSGSNQTVTTTSGNSVTVPAPTGTAGTFTYTLVSVLDGSTSGCSQLQGGSAIITVNPLPTATISGTTTVCKDAASPNITLTGASGTAPYTFTYKINNGSNQTITTTVGNSVTLPVPTGTSGTFTYALVSVRDASTTGCSQAQTGTAVVTVDAVPSANAGKGGDECDLTFIFNAVPSIGIGTWTKTTGPGTATFTPGANSPTATVTVSAYGTYTFTWTEVNVKCSSSSSITVNFYRQPVVNPGTGGNECDLNFKFSAVLNIGTGTWTKTSGPGTAEFAPSANSPTATVTVSEYGTYIFTWTELNVVCSKSAAVTVNFYESPTANPGTGGTNCGPEFFLNAVPSVGIGTWTKTAGSGTATFTPNANAPKSKVTVSAYGSYTFTWTEVNGTCSDNASTNVIFIKAPAADAGNGGEECDLDFNLNATPGSGTGTWTKSSGPGNAIFSPDANQPDATVTVDQFGTYDFAWTESNSTCKSTDIIRVIFRSLPSIDAGRDTILCEGESVKLHALGTGTFFWNPETMLDNPGISDPVASPVTTTMYKVTLTDIYGCKNTDSVKVEIWKKPVADAGLDRVLEYLFETRMEAADLDLHETGIWSLESGSAEFSDPDSSETYVTGLQLGENILLWTVSNGVCPPAKDYILITVNNLVIPTLITPNMDGKNDYFVLRGIETLGRTELVVFDRRGAQVYLNKDYQNEWDGVDYNNNPLPDDTYFFILKPQNGNAIGGYIVIRR